MAITDPMIFEQVRDALEALLIAKQSTFFRTIGEQKQSTDAEQVKGDLRTIQVFYSEGNYPQGKSSRQRLSHELTFQLLYTVSSPAKADLSILNNPEASASSKQSALLAMSEGSRLADRLMDELRRMVTQIIMSPVNQYLGLDKYIISDLWINNFRKSEPIDKGNLFVLTGAETLTCLVNETLIGETPVAATGPIADITILEDPIVGIVEDDDKPKVEIETLQ